MKDYFGFAGKTVVVTGASSGMGEAAAKMLIDLGSEVHATGNRKKITYDPAKEYYADFSEKSALDHLISQLPDKIDALFVCQGMSQGVNSDLTVQKVNFLSDKYLVEQLAPRIVENGSITIISSAGGFGWEQNYALCKEVIDCATYEDTLNWYETHKEAYSDGKAYTFSKQCLNTYVKYRVYNPLFIDRKIRINAICPGNTLTGLTDDFNRSASPTGNAEDGKRRIEKIFLDRWNGRWADATEMGYPMVVIGSQICSYMSGQVIFLDYGISSTWQIDGMTAALNKSRQV